ncbi:MAG: radical SAM protein [Pseudomonadota bacterium]|nr:MAG: radical SAM protein [Pseudomonadota bacterium]
MSIATGSQSTGRPPGIDADTLAYELHGNCYLNITRRCTLRCEFCPKFNGTWVVQDYDLSLGAEPDADQLVAAVGDLARYREVVFCGLGEPTLRLDVLLEVARRLKERGAHVRINTDGLANLVHGRDVTTEFAGLIDSVSVSMNAQDAPTYERHCRPKLEGAFDAILDFVRKVKVHVPEVTLTAIDGLPGVDIDACQRTADELGVSFRRRVLDVVG